MKKSIIILSCFIFLSSSLSAQKYQSVTVRAGMKVIDAFPFSERYRYPEFVSGIILVKTGVYSETKLNYNLLNGEMEYIRKKDTLAIANKKDVKLITAEQDTFYYDKGYYMEQLSGGKIKVVLKQYIKLKETQKKDSYGTSSSGSATTSYGSLPSQGNFYKMVANEDLVFQRTLEYYLTDHSGGFIQYNKKNVLQEFPQNKDAIKAYIKTNKINFNSREDLLKLADYLRSL